MRIRSALLAIIVSATVHAQATRVLFIGNSYTYSNDLPGLFTQLSAAMGETVQTGMSAPGGYTFNGHTQLAATQQLLAQGDWDFVVLQEQSQLPSFPQSQVETECFPYAALLAQQARQANACTEVVFLMTWGRENGDAQNCVNWPPVCTYAGMQQLLHERYLQMAQDNSAWCAPAGAVWSQWREQQPTAGLYSDGSHPNLRGSYLVAATLASTLFRRPCTAASWSPAGLDASEAAAIRQLASTTVMGDPAGWNIGVNDPVAEVEWAVLESGEVLFTSISSGADSLIWDFGDGGTSTESPVTHAYAGEGPYDAQLIVVDDCGRADTVVFSVSPAQGMPHPHASTEPPVRMAHMGDGVLRIEATSPIARLDLFDGTGRLVRSTRLPAGRSMLALGQRPGSIWIVHAELEDGQRFAGRILP